LRTQALHTLSSSPQLEHSEAKAFPRNEGRLPERQGKAMQSRGPGGGQRAAGNGRRDAFGLGGFGR